MDNKNWTPCFEQFFFKNQNKDRFYQQFVKILYSKSSHLPFPSKLWKQWNPNCSDAPQTYLSPLLWTSLTDMVAELVWKLLVRIWRHWTAGLLKWTWNSKIICNKLTQNARGHRCYRLYPSSSFDKIHLISLPFKVKLIKVIFHVWKNRLLQRKATSNGDK